MNFDQSPDSPFFVSTDKTLLDVPWITTELKRTYWGGWLELANVMKSIENSLCFGLYVKEHGLAKQIGFTRVVTDYATFAWVCDVFVTKDYRKRGLAKFMLQVVLGHPEVRPRSCLLCTKDAQAFYHKFNFQPMVCMKRTGGAT